MEKKYKLTDETNNIKGGFVESEDNLSHERNCWINAQIYDSAQVYGNAEVYDKVEVYGQARVYDDSVVCYKW